jgi:hypothetical protein
MQMKTEGYGAAKGKKEEERGGGNWPAVAAVEAPGGAC